MTAAGGQSSPARLAGAVLAAVGFALCCGTAAAPGNAGAASIAELGTLPLKEPTRISTSFPSTLDQVASSFGYLAYLFSFVTASSSYR